MELYLASLDATKGARRLAVFRAKELSSVEFGPASKGSKLWWSHHVQLRHSNNQLETRSGPMAHLPNICINHMGGGNRATIEGRLFGGQGSRALLLPPSSLCPYVNTNVR